MPAVERTLRTDSPLVPAEVLGSLWRGPGFPTYRVGKDGTVWWATSTAGPVLVRLAPDASDGAVRLSAWGEGAAWAADRLPSILGADDDPAAFDPALLDSSPFAAVRDAWRRWGPALRVPATGAVAECAALAVLEQRVTGVESRRAWVHLVTRFGEPSPAPPGTAPDGMMCPPAPEVWRTIPTWEWHRSGVDGSRSATVVRVMQRSTALTRLLDLPAAEARERLRSIDGVGQWTGAETAQRALGDADAVSFGDYHLAETMVYALTGDAGGTDEDLARLLEPAAGHRYRVQQLIERVGITRPRRGARMTIQDHRAH